MKNFVPSLFVIGCCCGGQSSRELFHTQTDVARSRPRTEKRGSVRPTPPHIDFLNLNTNFHNECLLMFIHEHHLWS